MNRRIRNVLTSRRSQAPRSVVHQQRADLYRGIAGVLVILVLLAALGAASVVKVGVTTYSAKLDESGAVRVGDEVRIAGITVGNVRSLSLGSDSVEMTFTVRDEIFVGDQTSLEIRMLTVVGGHYVALDPAGTTALDEPVPADRVILPYSLSRVFQDAIAPIQEINGDALRDNFVALRQSIDDSPESFRNLVGAAGNIVDILTKQNADISRTLAIADEYMSAFDGAKTVFTRLLHSLAILETLVENNRLALGETLSTLATTLDRIAPLGRAWDPTLQPAAQELADSLSSLEETETMAVTLVQSIEELGSRINSLLDPQGDFSIDDSQTTIVTPPLCIPVPGRSC